MNIKKYLAKGLGVAIILTACTGVSVASAALTFNGTTLSGDASVIIDNPNNISIGTSTATNITIGRTGQTVTLPGTVSITAGSCPNCFIGQGDISGTSTQKVIGLQGRAISSTAPSLNQALTWNGTSWAPATIATSTSGSSTAYSNIYQASSTNDISIGTSTDLGLFSVDGSVPFFAIATSGLVNIGGTAPISTSLLYIASSTSGSYIWVDKASGHLGVDNNNPANSLISVGSGTGSLNQVAGTGINSSVDSTTSSVPSAGRFNLNLASGSGEGLAISSVSRLDVNDTGNTNDAVALWGDTFVNSASSRNTWGINSYVSITSSSNYSQTAVTAELGYFNNISNNTNVGGELHLVSGNGIGTPGGYGQFGLLISGKNQNGILVQADTDGPKEDAYWFGPLAPGNIPTGTPLFGINASGSVGIGAAPSTAVIEVSNSTNNQLLRLTNPNPDLEFKETDVSNENYDVQMISGALSFRTDNSTFNAAQTRVAFTPGGFVGIGTSTPGAPLDVNGTSTILETPYTPNTSSAACTKGMMSWDTNYFYVCVANNTWKRATLSSF